MPPAVIAAGIGAAGAIGGSLLSSSAQKSAAQKATDATTNAENQATQAQLQLGQQSLGQARDIYNSNFNLLSPFVSRGNVAGGAVNALLGLPDAPQLSAPLAPAQGGQTGNALVPQQQQGPAMADIAAMQHDGIPGNYRAALAQFGGQQSSPLNSLAGSGLFGLGGLMLSR